MDQHEWNVNRNAMRLAQDLSDLFRAEINEKAAIRAAGELRRKVDLAHQFFRRTVLHDREGHAAWRVGSDQVLWVENRYSGATGGELITTSAVVGFEPTGEASTGEAPETDDIERRL